MLFLFTYPKITIEDFLNVVDFLYTIKEVDYNSMSLLNKKTEHKHKVRVFILSSYLFKYNKQKSFS